MMLVFQESIENERKDQEELDAFVSQIEQRIRKIDNFSAMQFMMKYLEKFKFDSSVYSSHDSSS